MLLSPAVNCWATIIRTLCGLITLLFGQSLGGFSDGASYAISLGLLNGDLFKGVMVFSPGFVIGGPWVGKPCVYISHGKHDRIVPIEKCGRRIAADLNARAYGVTLTEFDGGHEIPADVLREGFRWLGSL